MLALAAAVAAPWNLFIWMRYPVEAAGEALYTFRHISTVVEEQRTEWWTYLADLPRFFGELTIVGLVIAAASAFGANAKRELRVLLVWVAVPYLAFSLSATRLPAYVMIAAPAVFLLLAAGLDTARDWLPSRRALRTAGLAFLGLAVLLTARHLLEPRGPLQKRDRSPAWARQLERLDDRLGLADAVLFNVPKQIDAMFYSGYTAYERMPTEAEVRDIVARGRPVVIYQPAASPVAVPAGWPVIELPEAGR
jgi:4-amino-4-deoxy-L-arabinose transferase